MELVQSLRQAGFTLREPANRQNGARWMRDYFIGGERLFFFCQEGLELRCAIVEMRLIESAKLRNDPSALCNSAYRYFTGTKVTGAGLMHYTEARDTSPEFLAMAQRIREMNPDRQVMERPPVKQRLCAATQTLRVTTRQGESYRHNYMEEMFPRDGAARLELGDREDIGCVIVGFERMQPRQAQATESPGFELSVHDIATMAGRGARVRV